MTTLRIPDHNIEVSEFPAIQRYLEKHGIALTRWEANQPLQDNSTPEVILQAYAHELKPFMDKHGFKTADVINVHPGIENLTAIREKFLNEHTHSEDEVRFFVEGEGQFWFHFDNGEVAAVTCVAGDFLAVPKGFKHWFDLAPAYRVKAIRVFSTLEGWVANYTGSQIEKNYIKA